MIVGERGKYFYTSVEELKAKPEDLVEMVNDFKVTEVPRLEKLKSYLANENKGIEEAERRHEEDVSDVRASHGFANYIVTFMQGYMTGIPIRLVYEDSEEVQDKIEELNRKNKADFHNSLLERDASTYGRAYELMFYDGEAVHFHKGDVFSMFVIHDVTMEHKKIAAVRFYHNPFSEKDIIELHDDSEKVVYEMDGDEVRELDREVHGFSGVPLNELANNDERMGDFERVIPQIDLYDASQSDTANYMADFNDAILAIFGTVSLGGIEDPEKRLELMKKMRSAKLMQLIPPESLDGKQGNVDARYLTKQYDVAGTEAYKKRVENDIHKFSFTPDLTDERFAGTQSGKAMEYKLFSLEVVESNKENALKSFLQERYSLAFNLFRIGGGEPFEPENLEITITNKVPNSKSEAIESFRNLGGEMTNETKMRITGVVENAEVEQERLEEEWGLTPNLIDREIYKEPEEGEVDGVE